MKTINLQQTVKIPAGVEVSVKARKVLVKGPRGVLRRDFRHMAIDIRKTKKDGCWSRSGSATARSSPPSRRSAPTSRTCARVSQRATDIR